MAKKLVFQKLIAQSRKLYEQTEKTLAKEVYYIYNLFSKIDEFIYWGIRLTQVDTLSDIIMGKVCPLGYPVL